MKNPVIIFSNPIGSGFEFGPNPAGSGAGFKSGASLIISA